MLFGRNTRSVPFLFGSAEKSPRTLGNPQWNNNLKQSARASERAQHCFFGRYL
jgi:hypothetical protein